MLIFTNLSIWTVPFPSVFILFNSLQKEFADNFRPGTFHHLFLFFTEHFVDIVFRQLAELFTSNGIHYELGSLINIQIDLFISVQGEIVRVKTLLAFLTESLLEVRADCVGRIGIV